jgi:hypothetical protein
MFAARNARRQAVIACHREALEVLYAPSLCDSHSNGKQENNAEAMDTANNEKDRTDSIDLADLSFQYAE